MDDVLLQTREQFKDIRPENWRDHRSAIFTFMYNKLKQLVGLLYGLTLRVRKGGKAHSTDKKTGKATGGNRKPRACYQTRQEILNRVMA